jgi:hypothetical protein
LQTQRSVHDQNKALIDSLRSALYDLEPRKLEQQLKKVFAADAALHLAFPFEDVAGPSALFNEVYAPLIRAIPDLERRDYIVIAGAGARTTCLGTGWAAPVSTQAFSNNPG